MDFLLGTGVLWLSRGVVGVVFFVAGFSKLRSPVAFATAVRQYGILPRAPATMLARVLPYAEIVVGISMVLGVLSFYGSAAVIILLLLFMAAVLITVRRGHGLSCGCFGPGGNESGWNVLVRNGGLLALATSSAISPSGLLPVGPTIEDGQPLHLALFAVGFAALAVASTSYVSRLVRGHRPAGRGEDDVPLEAAQPTALGSSRRRFLGTALAAATAALVASMRLPKLEPSHEASAACEICSGCLGYVCYVPRGGGPAWGCLYNQDLRWDVYWCKRCCDQCFGGCWYINCYYRYSYCQSCGCCV